LGVWNTEEQQTLQERIKIAAEMIKSFCTIGLQLTMTQFNNK
jgi:PTH1 family peptidyl-tRNA hydrolase